MYTFYKVIVNKERLLLLLLLLLLLVIEFNIDTVCFFFNYGTICAMCRLLVTDHRNSIDDMEVCF